MSEETEKSESPKSQEKQEKAGSVPAGRRKRSAARLAAVQALYEMELSGRSAEVVITAMKERGVTDLQDEEDIPVDVKYFEGVVEGVSRNTDKLDRMVDECLGTGRNVARMEAVLRAIVRAGALELISRGDLDPPILISEYVHIGHAFFGGGEPGIVNGCLDKLSKTYREGELAEVAEVARVALLRETGADALMSDTEADVIDDVDDDDGER